MKNVLKPDMIATEIRLDICNGIYKKGERLPSERKLAERFNCTQVTINKAVEYLAREGFVEKKRGSGNYVMEDKKRFTVCFLIESQGDGLLNPVWYNVFESATMSAQNTHVQFRPYIIPFNAKIKGADLPVEADIIVAAIALHPERIEKLQALNKPIVWLEEWTEELPGTTVCFDNRQAGEVAARHLLGKGCDNFLYLKYSFSGLNTNGIYQAAELRFEGFQDELKKNGFAGDLMAYTCSGEQKELAIKLNNLLAESGGVNGVLCFSDKMVPLVIKSALDVGRQVPDDIAVMGIDGSELSKVFIPQFTTVTQPFLKIGKKVLEIVQKLHEGEKLKSKYLIKGELLERESTAKPIYVDQ